MKKKELRFRFRGDNIFEWSYLIIAAFFILMLATRSSFLYSCNDWNDANSYFSVGKALFNGKVPYRDVFDQKGMYLYFFYGIAYLISHTTFAGVFVLELVLAVFDLLAIYHILRMYMRKGIALILTPLSLAVMFSSLSFYWGGSAEEICLPFLLWGLFFSLRYFKNDYPKKAMDNKTLLIGGLLAGMIANIKFTSLGFFFAWMMCIAFSFLSRKDFFGAVKACFVFLGGMAVPFVPWFVYFAVHNALYYWYWGYVWINVFAYSNLNQEGPGLYERIYTLAKILYWLIIDNFGYFVFVIGGALFALLGKGKKWLERFNVLALCFFLFLGIYVGGSVLPYYALPLSTFTVMGFIPVGKVIQKLCSRKANLSEDETDTAVSIKKLAAGAVVLGMCIGITYCLSMNIPHMSEEKEDIFLYKFEKIVSEEENPTLLNIGCLDAGLYTVCDIVPTCQWFQTQTVIMDTVLSEQERYIREGQITFVIARESYPDVIWENYELVAEASWSHDEQIFTYYLFRKKE